MGVDTEQDHHWMREALRCAKAAEGQSEVPVGAVIVVEGRLLAAAHNRVIQDNDPTGHAEIVALRTAAAKEGNYRLPDATLFVTLEPCAMCAGAIVHARIQRVVYGAADPRFGAAGSLMDLLRDERLNHRCEVEGGVLAQECGDLLSNFFRRRR